MFTVTRTRATDTLANGNEIDLVETTAPDDTHDWPEDWYWLVQVITPKGEYVQNHTYTDRDAATAKYAEILQAQMLAPLPGICYVCGNGDEDLKPTRYGLTVGHLPADRMNVNVPMCPECRGE